MIKQYAQHPEVQCISATFIGAFVANALDHLIQDCIENS